MDVYSFDPLGDLRWNEFVERHPKASVFHTSGWLTALQRTYRFEPIAFTTSRPRDELRNALPFCVVRSWLTGRRLISLPFSDHCEPLVDEADALRALCASVFRLCERERWTYVEMRPLTPIGPPDERFKTTQAFHSHRLDLSPTVEALRQGCHKDSIRRKVRRAERERLTYEEGRSQPLLRKLCHLLDLTRRRHGVPLQPPAWFQNLVECFGDRLAIRVASSRDGQPAAGILTIAHGRRVVYKYGGSDARLHPLGGMPFVLWRAIQDAKLRGADELDLGRSDLDNLGLAAFKEHLGASRSPLTYWRGPGEVGSTPASARQMRLAKHLFARLPAGLQRTAGAYLYPHLA
jgi:GNAT acetyltransferase-like protein